MVECLARGHKVVSLHFDPKSYSVREVTLSCHPALSSANVNVF